MDSDTHASITCCIVWPKDPDHPFSIPWSFVWPWYPLKGPSTPRSRSDVDDEATLDHVNSTFLDQFERDVGVLPAFHDGVHPHGEPVPEFGVLSASQEFVIVDAVVLAGEGQN